MNIGHQKWQSKVISLVAIVLLMSSCQEKEATINDWAQFKKDNFRSANSPVQLDIATLGEEWVYKAPQLPVPAWYGPAKEDTYANSGPLPSMRDYDLAYYPIVVGTKLYYGSTADKAIHCLDTKTGEELWVHTTGGAIHVAPTYYLGNLYFGSDDGFAYCIKASNGKLVWKYSPTQEKPKKVMHNNSLISFWPVRTGLLIEDDIAYFGASLLPWKESYFCALNIKTGKPDTPGAYIKKYDNLTLEGAMASTGTKIIQPQGRISPIFFDKSNGDQKGQLAGTGGCFVLVTPEKNIVHPNNTRAKGIAETIAEHNKPFLSENTKKADFMSFKDGKEMVVKDSVSYILTDNSISAYNRVSKKVIWANHNYQAHRIMVSGNVLFVGTTDKVYAVSLKNGYPLWEAPVKGAVYALVVAQDALYAATGEGYIYAFKSGKAQNMLFAENKDKPAIIEGETKRKKKVVESNFEFSAGPFINVLGPNTVEIHFITENPEKCTINFGNDFGTETINEGTAKTEHKIVVNNVRKDFTYQYQMIAGDKKTKFFEFDNFFNYKEAVNVSKKSSKVSKLVSEIKNLNKNTKGIGLVFGTKNEDLALQIAEETTLKVIVFETSNRKVNKLRKKLQRTGFYGSKIEVQLVKDYKSLPITSDVANFVVVNNYKLTGANEIIRLIKPKGYAILNGKEDVHSKWLSKSESSWQVTRSNSNNFELLKKRPIEASGEWSHQYGLPDNSAFGGESLWGSTSTEDFEIQWMGRPGPRFQTDRSGRKPSPLAVNGKMFVQGKERIIAVDAYNGNVHWSKEIPDLSRMNLVRDCSNWVADSDFVYVAHKNNLLVINANNGKMNEIIPVKKGANSKGNDWGYISLVKDIIIGSAIPKGSNYTNYYGGQGWYDAKSGPLAYQVVSNSLFARKKEGKELLWNYEKEESYIINSTITITNNQICFVESRNSKLKLTKDGRADPDVFKNLYMVSINPETGNVNWEHAINTKPGITAYFMVGSGDRIVILASNEGKYYIYNYNAVTGKLEWEKDQSWYATHHGAHMSKPAIVNNRLIVKPAMYKLDTGELLKEEVPKAGHGCASYALSEQSIFYRGGSVTQFNFDTDKFSKWERLRPDCWLSTIPAQGMVLSPEAGGGCSCGNWLETSMVFAPISRAPITFLYEDEKFVDMMSISIKARDVNNKKIFYTLDGSTPTNKSKQYTHPFIITKNVEVKAVIYVEKDGGNVPFIRTKEFVRLRPIPTIAELPELIDGNWQFSIERNGTTGEIHYTIDGSVPTINSPKYESLVIFTEKTLVKAKTFWEGESILIESEETSFEITIPKLLENVKEEVKKGVSIKYFKGNGKESEIPNLKLLKPLKNINSAEISSKYFEKKKDYALQFDGFINIPKDGMYTFSNETFGGFCTVLLHNKKQIENKGKENKDVVIPLKKGLHPITINHFVKEISPSFQLEIEGPEISKQPIPSNWLFTKK